MFIKEDDPNVQIPARFNEAMRKVNASGGAAGT